MDNHYGSLQLLSRGNCLQKLEAINLVQFNVVCVISCTRCVEDRSEGNNNVLWKLLALLLEERKYVTVKMNDALKFC